MVAPYLRPKAPLIPYDANPVELVAMAPSPSASAASFSMAPRPPEPPPPPEPEGAHAVEKIPDPVKKEPKPEVKKPPEIKKVEPPKPPTPEPPTPGPSGTGTPSGHAGPAGAAQGPAGITALGSGEPGLNWYNASIASALENAWTKPVLEGVGGVQSVIVTFDIGADGNPSGVSIDVSSGIASLDRSALRAVQDAAPFPPPPASAGSSVRQRIRFDLRPDAN